MNANLFLSNPDQQIQIDGDANDAVNQLLEEIDDVQEAVEEAAGGNCIKTMEQDANYMLQQNILNILEKHKDDHGMDMTGGEQHARSHQGQGHKKNSFQGSRQNAKMRSNSGNYHENEQQSRQRGDSMGNMVSGNNHDDQQDLLMQQIQQLLQMSNQ